MTRSKTTIRSVFILAVVVVSACVFYACRHSLENFLSHDEEAVVVSPLAKRLGYSKDRPLVVGMNVSYAPLQYVDDHGKPSGYDVEFTTKLMRRMGIPFTLSPNHWDKMSPGIINGKYDLGMLVYSHYRKDVTNYSQAVFRLYYQIVYRKDEYEHFDFRHLKGKKIAYMKSRPIGLMLKSAEANEHSITDLEESISDLAKGKYDGVICYRFQAAYYIAQLHLENKLKTDELSLEPREYCYASYNKELIDSINAELTRMTADGTIDEVYGQTVVSKFGGVSIPQWVWGLLVFLIILFLTVFGIHRYRLSKRLQAAYDQVTEKNKALTVANARAEESARMKSAFIKQISHEIRTPLNIVNGFTQILTNPELELSEEDRKDISHRMNESTSRITDIVDKMLELADIHSIAVLERKDHVSARVIAGQAIAASGIDKAQHLTFTLETEEGADEEVLTNQRSVERVLELLLDNAMKFTHPAENYMAHAVIEQKEARLRIGCENGVFRFVVEDTGIGVPEEEAERIFDEFVQLDEYYDGTGNGLAVARSLARRLGGDVVLDTSYSGGARFVLTLPAEP